MNFKTDPTKLDTDDCMALQRELRAAGYYTGRIDGDWGDKSKAAWILAQTQVKVFYLEFTPEKAAEYMRFWALADLVPAREKEVRASAARLLSGRDRYAAVEAATGVPWWVIGLIHGRECDYSFAQHLHNGDSLKRRTIQVPAGRPKTGTPPFTWEYSAADALVADRFKGWTDWSLPAVLYKLEGFNGTGYRARRLPAPYLWSFTVVGRAGKYVADHVFSATAWDQQPGVAAVLKVLAERGAVPFDVVCFPKERRD